ncbi:MAG: hypothetical protein QM831_01385 [Kofleriaceae bacterium]
MSNTITIAVSTAPDMQAVLDTISETLHINDLRIVGDMEDVWPEGVQQLYRDKVSTRYTEVSYDGSEFAVRIFTNAWHEDVELALAFVEVLAAHGETEVVDAEGFGELRVDELAANYDRAWTEAQFGSGIGAIAHLIKDGRGPIQMPGPNRPVYVDRALLDDMAKSHDDAVRIIREIRWNPRRTAGEFVARDPAGTEKTLALWIGDDCIFPSVEWLAISPTRDGKNPFLIPAIRLRELAGDKWHRLDASQAILDAITDDGEWAAIVAHARGFLPN